MNHWFSTRYGYTIKPEWVTLGAGIVYALGTSVKAFTEEGDAMMVMQPVYYPFSEVIKNDGRKENRRCKITICSFVMKTIVIPLILKKWNR